MAPATPSAAPLTSAATPLRVTLDYGDGVVATVPFAELPAPLRADLLRQPFTGAAAGPAPSPLGDADPAGRFLLLEWDDGWNEVRRVPASCTGVGRYYMISRTEETGRLALTTDTDYPELVEVTRRPGRLRRITLDATLELTESHSAREGGKTDHFYAATFAGDATAEWRASLQTAAIDEGIDLVSLADALAAAGGPIAAAATATGGAVAEQLERLRRRLHLCASFAQRDVLDFVAALVLTIDRDRAAAGRPS